MAVIEARVTGTGQELCDHLGCPRRSRETSGTAAAARKKAAQLTLVGEGR
jgi:hypothetical protein